MKDAIGGWWALSLLTLREIQRQRLWILVVAGAALLLAAVPSLRAVDDEARLKLSVSAVVGATGFIVILLAALVGAAALRRDIESRTGYLLFAKPLPRMAYLLGRWSGVVAALLVCVLLLGAAGTLAIWLRLGDLPQPRRVAAPSAFTAIEVGQAVPLAADSEAFLLAGNPQRGEGEAIRWRFDGLPDRDSGHFDLLLRVAVGGSSMGLPVQRARVSVTAETAEGQVLVLPLAPDSPYGQEREGIALVEGQALLLGRASSRDDLAQDYARFRIPAELVEDGSVAIQLNRLDTAARLRIDRESAFVVLGGGSFALNLARALLVSLAQAALLCAATLAMVTVARIGTALLGALTLTFAGSALAYIEDGLAWQDVPLAAERLLRLLMIVLPDFSRFDVESAVASSRQVAWGTVGEAWAYFGIYAAVFLVLAWLGMRKVDL